MNNFDKLHKLKLDTQHALENIGYIYHGGSINGDEMKAALHVSLHGKKFNISICLED